MRTMSEHDIKFFEGGFVKVMIQFVKSLAEPVKGLLKSKNYHYYLDYVKAEFIEHLDEEKE